MSVRLNDVAKHAGVALDTARRALDGASSVRPYLKERVEAAARELGYHPNLVARALKKKELWVVPVSVIELGNPFFGRLAQHLSDELVAAGLEPVLCVDPQHLLKLRRTICATAGILAVGLNEEKVREISAQMKLVTINSSLPQMPDVSDIEFDFISAYRRVCLRLKSEGRQRVTIFSPFHALTRKHGWRNPKTEAIVQVCREEGFTLIVHSGEVIMNSFSQMETLWGASGRSIDAVFCENDLCAAELSAQILQRGVRVPEDLRLIGCDGNFRMPGLWTLRLDTVEISRLAISMLCKLYEGDDVPSRISLTPEFSESIID